MKWKRYVSILTVSAMLAGSAACSKDTESISENIEKEAEASQTSAYLVTEENENKELIMNNQPESSCWFPKQLLEWEAVEDPDLAFNISTVPLAKRVDRQKLSTVNSTQNKDTNIMAISIMNSSTSGNAPHGLNKVDANTFSYWQYVDTLVYWGGSSGEGIIVPPSPDVTDAGHKNGVKVLGTVFFPQDAHGGKIEWLDDFLVKDDSGSFPMVDKLIEVADIYGFDGWFLNQETEGNEEGYLTVEHVQQFKEFVKQFKEKSADLEIVYYDSMTKEGKIDWQNALTDENISFLKDDDGKAVSDSMFLNFWWTEDKLAADELLKSSAAVAEENEIDPYSLYAGIDIQSDGFTTPIRWDLFEKTQNSTYTSLGIYCPNWAYTEAGDMEDFFSRENALWVNSKGDPSADISYSSNIQWRGISTYAVERSAITSLPFITNFNMGNGYSFFKNGEQISKLDWNNRSLSDIQPTYRYIIQNEGNNSLSAGYDVANAYYGGSSLKLRGNMEKGSNSVIKLYSAELPVENGVVFTTTAKASSQTMLSAVLELEDGSIETIKGDKGADKEWTDISFDISELAGKTIKSISYQLSTEEASEDYEFYFGNITIAENLQEALPVVSNVTADSPEFDEDAMYAGIRLTWESDLSAAFYEVYRINQDNTRSLLGVSNTTNFYINTLPRTDETNKSVFEVVPVTDRLNDGTGSQVTVDWPDNSVPKADFKADVTLIAPGQTVKFTSSCSANTESVAWSLQGADKTEAEGEEVSVTYPEEGVYDVAVTAQNKSGTDEKRTEGCIVVTNKAAEGLKLLSKDALTTADTFVNENEAPQFAVDGDIKKKWCATGNAPHEITIDLGAAKTVSAVDVYHAEAGGEGADMNTKAYSVMISEDNADYQEMVSVTRNTLGTTHDTFTPVKARYVKVIINKPTQGSDSAARIYEIEVYGLDN